MLNFKRDLPLEHEADIILMVTSGVSAAGVPGAGVPGAHVRIEMTATIVKMSATEIAKTDPAMEWSVVT